MKFGTVKVYKEKECRKLIVFFNLVTILITISKMVTE